MSLGNVNLQELQLRKSILQKIINDNKDDPRIAEPQRQLDIIESEIKRRTMSEDVVISLDSLNIKSFKE